MKPVKSLYTLSNIEFIPVTIVNDALIASREIGDGRMIPLVILDTNSREDINELARIHRTLPPGDCISSWGQKNKNETNILLLLEFIKPVELVIILEFDIERQGGLVDQILMVEALYIQPGKPNQRLINTMEADKILIEIPDRGFKQTWDKIFRKSLQHKFKSKGLNRREAKHAVDGFISEWRSFGGASNAFFIR